MKAIRFHRLGGPEVAQLDEVPIPELKSGCVLIRHEYVAVNFGDLLFMRGEYLVAPVLPDIPGMEAAGIVIAVAPDVVDLELGTRVGYINLGAFAEFSVVRQSRVVPLPGAVTAQQGAAFLVAGLTAYHLLHSVHRLRSGETVVVHSAAGGVGMAAVQIAKAGGARVIGIVSSPEKAAAARLIGADEVIEYDKGDFGSAILDLTGGNGADLILDGVGAPTFELGLDCLANFGHLILFGRAGGWAPMLDPNRLFAKSQTVSGFALPLLYRNRPVIQASIQALLSLLQSGQLNFPIHRIWPLAEARSALEAISSRAAIGKALLHVT